MYELTENNYDLQNEYIDFLDKKYIFRKLDNMSQLKILTYLLPYEIHRLSKKTFTKKIKYKIFKKVKRKRKVPVMKWNNEKNDYVIDRYNVYYSSTKRRLTNEEYKKYNGKKNINLFFKGLRLSYKFIYHRCINNIKCRARINRAYGKSVMYVDNNKALKNNFYYGYCITCELYKKNIYDNRNMRYLELNGKCLLLDSSDDEEPNQSILDSSDDEQ